MGPPLTDFEERAIRRAEAAEEAERVKNEAKAYKKGRFKKYVPPSKDELEKRYNAFGHHISTEHRMDSEHVPGNRFYPHSNEDPGSLLKSLFKRSGGSRRKNRKSKKTRRN